MRPAVNKVWGQIFNHAKEGLMSSRYREHKPAQTQEMKDARAAKMARRAERNKKQLGLKDG